jgi:hypothetical protein
VTPRPDEPSADTGHDGDEPDELEESAEAEQEYPADETDEG